MGRRAGRHSGSGLGIGRVVLAYVALAGLWIVLSDVAAGWLWPEAEQRFLVSLTKGLAFVLVTGVLFGALLRHERQRTQRRTLRQVATTAALLEHFRALSERVSDAVLLVDATGRIVEANEAATKLLGWDRGALCERNVEEIEIEMAAGGETARGSSYEANYRLADGRILPVEVDVLALQVGARALRQFIVRDATGHPAGEGGHRGRAWVDVFFDMPFIGMAITSPTTKRWIRFNDRLCEILGHTREEVARLTWAEMTHPADLPRDEAQFERVLGGEISGYRLQKRFVRRDGSIVHTEIDVRCRRLPDGRVDYFVCTVQDVTERFEAAEHLRRQKNLYAALSRINTAITRLPTREQMFREVCDAVVGIGRFKFAWVLAVDLNNMGYRFETQAGDDGGFVSKVLAHGGATASVERTSPAKAARSGRAVICDPYRAVPENAPWVPFAEAAGIAASGAFPILFNGEVVAVLNVYSDRSGDFDADTVALIEEVARDVSFALENRQREETRSETLAALAAAEARARFALEGAGHGAWEWDLASGRVTYSGVWRRMFGYADDEISDSAEEWRSRIHPEDADAALAGIEAHLAGRTPSYVNEHRVRCKDGSYKWILDRGQVLERAADGRPLKFFGTKTDLSEVKAAEEQLRVERQRMDLARSSASIGTWDLDVATRTLHLHRDCGALFGFDAEPRALTVEDYVALLHPEDRDTLHQAMGRFMQSGGEFELCLRFNRPDGSMHWIEHRGVMYCDAAGRPLNACGISMDVTGRMAAERKIRDYVARLERSMLGTVDAISHMVDLRDPYTAGHELRVGELAAALGRELGLDEANCQGLNIIGRVHDIGKITVPAEILSKPGRLTDMEMNIVRTHAQQGYEILRGIEFDWPVAEVIRQHHERLDGSGYPRGLKGEEIMLEARILAVADVVESMASHRPYRPAHGTDVALAEIEAQAGVLYDAQVVQACLRLFRERGFEFATRGQDPGATT